MSEFKRHKSVKAKKPNNIIITLKGFIKDLTKDIKTVDVHLEHEHGRSKLYEDYIKDMTTGVLVVSSDDLKHTSRCLAAAKKRIAKWESVRASLIVVRRGYEDDLRTLRECNSFLSKHKAIDIMKQGDAAMWELRQVSCKQHALNAKYMEYAV